MTNFYDDSGRVAEQRDGTSPPGITCFHYEIKDTYSGSNCPNPNPPPGQQQTIMVDPLGYKTTYTTDSQFRIGQVMNHLNGVASFGYNTNHEVTCATDQLGRKTGYVYDSKGNLTQLIDANNTDPNNPNCVLKSGGASWNYTYTALNDPSQITDPLGNPTFLVHNSLGNLTRMIRHDYAITVGQDADMDVYADTVETHVGTSTTTACGFTPGAPTQSENWPPDLVESNSVNVSDVLAMSPYMGQNVPPAPVRYDLAPSGSINVSDVLALKAVFNSNCPLAMELTCFEVDSAGLVQAVVQSMNLNLPADPNAQCAGNKTKFEYNASGNMTAVVDPRFAVPGTPKTTLVPDAGGRVQSVTNELNHVTNPEYDNFNMLTSVADPSGNVASRSYDYKGNLETVMDPNRQVSGTAEACGATGTGDGADSDLDQKVDDGCSNYVYNYDEADRLKEVIEAAYSATQSAPKTTYGYDANNNLTSVMNANRQPVGPAETACGAGTGDGVNDDPGEDTVADDGCPSTIYVYDALNRLASTMDALGRVTSYQYDAASNLTQRTDARGLVTKYFPDLLDRLIKIEYWNGTTLVSSVNYAYDAVGNRTSMADSTGTTTYTYDALYRLKSADPPASNAVLYAYDAVGNRTKMTYPDGKVVTYAYYPNGQLQTVTDWLGKVTTYEYNNARYLTKATLGNNVWTDYGYDNADRLTSVANKRPGPVTISSFTYALDATGNRKQMTNLAGGIETYQYDPLYRLTQAAYPGGPTDNYTYDAVGNRLTKNGIQTQYVYDAADQMTSADGVAYGYDNNGNQTDRGPDDFFYDHENRLTQTVISGATATSAYNGDGLRMSHTVSGVTTNYVWDVASGLPVVLQDGTNTYVYGLDLISATDGAGVQTYFTYDGLGSTRDLTNGTGQTTGQYTYDVFGATLSGPSGNAWQFPPAAGTHGRAAGRGQRAVLPARTVLRLSDRAVLGARPARS